MAMRKSKKTTKRIIRKGRKPRRRLPTNVAERASCSVQVKIVDGETNTMYGSNTFSLDKFDRAVAIARAYQEYRITSCKFTFKPHFDTFLGDTNATTSYKVPQFYHMIDKAQALPANTTLTTLRSMGAKPRRFDDKNLTVTYSPAVQNSVWDGGVALAPTMPRTSPWLSTNVSPDSAWTPSTVDHGGLFYILDTQGALPGDGQYEYGVELEVQFQFRKPLQLVEAGAVDARPLVIHQGV